MKKLKGAFTIQFGNDKAGFSSLGLIILQKQFRVFISKVLAFQTLEI